MTIGSPDRRAKRPGLLFAVVTHVVLFALGIALAMYGALLSARGPGGLHHIVSVGIGIAVIGNVFAATLGRVAVGRAGGVTPVLGWLLVVCAFSVSRSNGSVLLPGGDLALPSLLFEILGTIAGAIAAVAPLPRRRVS